MNRTIVRKIEAHVNTNIRKNLEFKMNGIADRLAKISANSLLPNKTYSYN